MKPFWTYAETENLVNNKLLSLKGGNKDHLTSRGEEESKNVLAFLVDL